MRRPAGGRSRLGSIIMVGAYLTWLLFRRFGIEPLLLAPAVMALFFVAGYLFQYALVNRVVRASMFTTLLLTFGLDYILINSGILLWTSDFRLIQTSYSGSSLHLGAVAVPYVRLVGLVAAIVLTALLYLLMERTRTGQAIRAVSMDVDAARLVGINPASIYSLTFAVGAALAAVAGTMTSVTMPFTPNIGPGITLKAFVITILGGLGTVWGPLLGGVLLGTAESVGGQLIGTGYANVISFVLLVVMLVLRPQGQAGKEGAG